MSFHAAIAFPDDNDETLEKVLRLTRTGAISSPLARCVSFTRKADAIMARMFGGQVVDDVMIIFDGLEERELRAWMDQSASFGPTFWHAIERFEFFRLQDVERLADAYRAVTGVAPNWVSLDLWPEMFPVTTPSP